MRNAAMMRRAAAVTAAAASLAACATVAPERGGYASVDRTPAPRPAPPASGGAKGTSRPYQVNGVWYVPREQPGYDQVGVASWYGAAFHAKTTANGELFDMNAVTGAHTTLPLPSIVEVTNLDNGRRVRVRLNDRGPFVGDRIIDLSREAARQLGYERQGLARVRVRYVGPAPLLGPEAGIRVASAGRTGPVATPTAAPASAQPAPMGRASLTYRDPAAAFTSKAASVASVRRMDVLPTLGEARAAAAAAASADAAAYRIQAGAFREEARARQAAARLNRVGPSVVEPVERDGVTLWRVTVQGPQDRLQAYNLRQRVAEAGFGDAQVVGPF